MGVHEITKDYVRLQRITIDCMVLRGIVRIAYGGVN